MSLLMRKLHRHKENTAAVLLAVCMLRALSGNGIYMSQYGRTGYIPFPVLETKFYFMSGFTTVSYT
jgi:hypothetical protein